MSALLSLMSSSELSPLQRAFNSFLLSMPSHQLEELVEYLQARENHQSKSHVGRGNQTPIKYPTPDDTASEGTALSARRGSVASTNNASKSSAARRRNRDKPLRPLNSFIAFRSKSKIPHQPADDKQLTLVRLLLDHVSRPYSESQVWNPSLPVAERPFQGQMGYPCQSLL